MVELSQADLTSGQNRSAHLPLVVSGISRRRCTEISPREHATKGGAKLLLSRSLMQTVGIQPDSRERG
jgi:hypothetical protein